MSLPPQEPPRGPPSLNVSQKSHKVKKQQPPRPSAVASQSHHPPAPPPLEDYLASLEQQLMNELIPPEVVSTQTVPSLNEFGSASNILPNQPESFPSGEGSFLPNPPPSRSIPGPWRSLPPPAVAGGSSILQMMPVNSPAAGSSFWPSASSEYSPSASSSAASLPPESSPDGSCYDGVDSTPPPSPPPDPSA